MSIPDGKVKANGVIIGTWPPFPAYHPPVDRSNALIEVVGKLRRQYALAVALQGQGDETPYLSNRRRSAHFTAGPNGAVVRVLHGAGLLIVSNTNYELDHGGWAYIPHRQSYQLEGRIISGINFRVTYANLVRS